MDVRVIAERCGEPLVIGLDEAGRGPMIGPMVVAVAGLPRRRLQALVGVGARDSKAMTPRSRERVRAILERMLDFAAVGVVEPWEIDEAVWGRRYGSLNVLEAVAMAELIRLAADRCRVEAAYVDSPDPVPERFAAKLSEETGVVVVAENDADKKYVIVSAASILAKTERDRLVEALKARYGDFGSGYPSDPRTREWAARWLEGHGGEPPPIARRSWKSWRKVGRV